MLAPPSDLSVEKFPVKWDVNAGILLFDACLDKKINTLFGNSNLSMFLK